METKQFYGKTLSVAKKINLINKLGGKCSMCGELRHWVLEFHHEGDKEFVINQNIGRRLSNLEIEAEKCICVCSNCHREIHNSGKETQLSKSKIKMLEYKNTNCCSKCGYSKLNSALEFHHIDPNTKLMMMSEYRGSSSKLTDEIKTELDKCIVLCVNCHREEHYDLEFFETNKEYILNKSQNIKELQPELDKQEVLRLYESGMKQIDIAKKYKASKGTINGILKQFGKTRDMNNMIIDRNYVYILFEQGKTGAEISRMLNVDSSSISNIKKELGLR